MECMRADEFFMTIAPPKGFKSEWHNLQYREAVRKLNVTESWRPAVSIAMTSWEAQATVTLSGKAFVSLQYGDDRYVVREASTETGWSWQNTSVAVASVAIHSHIDPVIWSPCRRLVSAHQRPFAAWLGVGVLLGLCGCFHKFEMRLLRLRLRVARGQERSRVLQAWIWLMVSTKRYQAFHKHSQQAVLKIWSPHVVYLHPSVSLEDLTKLEYVGSLDMWVWEQGLIQIG